MAYIRDLTVDFIHEACFADIGAINPRAHEETLGDMGEYIIWMFRTLIFHTPRINRYITKWTNILRKTKTNKNKNTPKTVNIWIKQLKFQKHDLWQRTKSATKRTQPNLFQQSALGRDTDKSRQQFTLLSVHPGSCVLNPGKNVHLDIWVSLLLSKSVYLSLTPLPASPKNMP